MAKIATMSIRLPFSVALALGAASFCMVGFQDAAPAQPQNCEQVFKNIQVFKGVPANDLIPSMEFMAASMKMECTGCHDPKDYAAETRAKDTARRMILMQREINEKHFNNRPEVTCYTCHHGKEHPDALPIPEGVSLRHERTADAPPVADLFAKHIAGVGKPSGAIVRTGTLTAPNDATHKPETLPLEFIQADGGKFRLVSGERKVGSNGTQAWYGNNPMFDEPAAIFGRLGRAWQGENAFAGLERTTVSGKDKIGKTATLSVRGNRASTMSTEDLSFDAKSGLLMRLVNVRRCSLGTVVTAIDYQNYKNVGGVKTPMRVVLSFAGGEQWIMDFKSAKVDPKIDPKVFEVGG